ncbi:hypothetical protein BHE74_00039084, partial [Ensete ventricosum]
QDLIFGTLIRHLEKAFPGGKNDMTNADLVATLSYPRTAGPPTWPTRRGQLAGRKNGGRQWTYSRPDTGKVGTPYLQTHASLQGQQALWKSTTTW